MQLLRSTPLVSVIMSVRNDARFVAQAIGSILRQTTPDFEFIIFDDGSTDSSRQVIDSFPDARIRVSALPGVGLASALNQGLAMARGVYVARQDADDVSQPERLQRQIACLDAHPDISILGTAITAIDQDGRQLRDYEYPLADAEIRKELARMRNPLVHGSLMYRRQQVVEIHGYRPAFRKSEDYDMLLRAAGYLQFANLRERLLKYRLRLDSMSGRRDEEALRYSLLGRALAAARSAGIEDCDALLADLERALAGWFARRGMARFAHSGYARRSAVIAWFGARRVRALRELWTSLRLDPQWPIRERVLQRDPFWNQRIEDELVTLFRATVENRRTPRPAA